MSRSGGCGITRAAYTDVARLVVGDLVVDPVLILGDSGVDSWEIGLSAAMSKTHHSSLNPHIVF